MAKNVTGTAQAPETYWRSFPFFETTLTSERPAVMGKIESTCRKLDALIKDGSPQDQARARSAMAAYARTLELYRQLVEMRDKAVDGK
jgi:hypothetical protein